MPPPLIIVGGGTFPASVFHEKIYLAYRSNQRFPVSKLRAAIERLKGECPDAHGGIWRVLW